MSSFALSATVAPVLVALAVLIGLAEARHGTTLASVSTVGPVPEAIIAPPPAIVRPHRPAAIPDADPSPQRTTAVETHVSAADDEPALPRAQLMSLRDKGLLLPSSPPRIVVRDGQTLWRLARELYGRGADYRLLYEANRDRLASPHRIWPGQVLDAPPRRGGE